MSAERRPTLPYEPALDGIRGVAVAAVLCFHGGFGWASGGFLGVSTFFTLSGFLITSLLLAEQRADGTITLGRFWARRFRRLVPAALVCIAGTVILCAVYLTAARGRLRGDVVGAVLDVANWRFYLRGDSYLDLFAAPSPLAHFWSLAIEEQFYLLFPPLMWWLLVRRRVSIGVLGVVLAGLGVAATVAAVVVGRRDADLAYYATFTRAPELLAGAVLAVALARRPLAQSRRVRRALMVIGPMALALELLWFAGTTQSAGWLYRGGLPLIGVVSAALVAGALVPGPLRFTLSVWPVAALGRISYGVYLYHWPIFLVLSAGRTGWSGWPLFTLRSAVTVAVATASYLVIELPVRRGQFLHGWSARLSPLAGAVTVSAAALLVGSGGGSTPALASSLARPTVTLPPRPVTSVVATSPPNTATASTAATTTVAAPATTVPAAPTTTLPAAPVRIVVFGDSVAKIDAGGLISWGAQSGRAVVSDAGAIAGCGLLRAGEVQLPSEVVEISSGCATWPTRWPQVLTDNPADVAVLITGAWELADHRLPGDDSWRGPGDALYDETLRAELSLAVDTLLATGTPVVVVTALPVDVNWAGSDESADDPSRVVRLNEIIAGVAQERPGVGLVDFAGWMAAQPGDPLRDAGLRPDGVHFNEGAAVEVASWLGPAIIEAIPG